MLRLLVFAAAVIGYLAGVAELVMHLAHDLLADVRAYYDAGTRLNAGLPLYPAGANPDVADCYRYRRSRPSSSGRSPCCRSRSRRGPGKRRSWSRSC